MTICYGLRVGDFNGFMTISYRGFVVQEAEMAFKVESGLLQEGTSTIRQNEYSHDSSTVRTFLTSRHRMRSERHNARSISLGYGHRW